jgi:hypothetical protein
MNGTQRWYLRDGAFAVLGRSEGIVPPHAHHAIEIVVVVEGRFGRPPSVMMRGEFFEISSPFESPAAPPGTDSRFIQENRRRRSMQRPYPPATLTNVNGSLVTAH